MKTKILLLILFSSFFACQNTIIEEKEDWIQQIDKEIYEFEKTKSIFKESEFIENSDTVSVLIFKSEKSVIIKYVLSSQLGEMFPMKSEFYVKDNQVFFTKWFGLSPYINKGIKTENTKWCVVFEKKTYFKKTNEAIVFSKKLDLKNINEYELSKVKLLKMPFEELEVKDAQIHYDRALQTIVGLSDKINK